MSRKDWERLALHLPWGLMGASLMIPHIGIGITATSLMLVYEVMNDWRKGDSSYKDVLGIVWGFLIGSYVFGFLGLVN